MTQSASAFKPVAVASSGSKTPTGAFRRGPPLMRTVMPESKRDAAWSRDEQLKPGRPPRSAHEPAAAEGSARTDKTRTDPATGAPVTSAPRPNQADNENDD